MAKWYVRGLDEKTMKPKTVIVTATNKQEAIIKGLNLLKSNRLFDCTLKSTK